MSALHDNRDSSHNHDVSLLKYRDVENLTHPYFIIKWCIQVFAHFTIQTI